MPGFVSHAVFTQATVILSFSRPGNKSKAFQQPNKKASSTNAVSQLLEEVWFPAQDLGFKRLDGGFITGSKLLT